MPGIGPPDGAMYAGRKRGCVCQIALCQLPDRPARDHREDDMGNISVRLTIDSDHDPAQNGVLAFRLPKISHVLLDHLALSAR